MARNALDAALPGLGRIVRGQQSMPAQSSYMAAGHVRIPVTGSADSGRKWSEGSFAESQHEMPRSIWASFTVRERNKPPGPRAPNKHSRGRTPRGSLIVV